jgi:hypothetical protein
MTSLENIIEVQLLDLQCSIELCQERIFWLGILLERMANTIVKNQLENYDLKEIDEILAFIKNTYPNPKPDMPIKRNRNAQDKSKKKMDTNLAAKKKNSSN